jgi:hypothetical protein
VSSRKRAACGSTNGDHVSAQRKGINRPDRVDQVPMMAQMQNIIDFPPAPKPLGLKLSQQDKDDLVAYLLTL